MDRRSFLRVMGLGAASVAAAATFDVERLLWVPGARTYFLPSPNTLITPEWVSKEVARMFLNQIKMTAAVNRQYDHAFGLLAGSQIRVPMPARFA